MQEVDGGTARADARRADGGPHDGPPRPSRGGRHEFPARRGRRLWLDVAIGVLLLVLVAVGALRWYDSTAYRRRRAPDGGAVRRRRPADCSPSRLSCCAGGGCCVPVVAALAVAATVAAPAFRATSSPKASRDLTVMSANMWIGAANAGQLMDAVRFHAVDVLVLTEATPAILRRLDAEGASDYFTHREGIARASTFTGTMVLSRYPLSVRNPGTDVAVEATQSVQPEVDVTAPEGTVRLKVAHPTAPLAGDTGQWRAGLRALQSWKEQLDGDQLGRHGGRLQRGLRPPGFPRPRRGTRRRAAHRRAGLGAHLAVRGQPAAAVRAARPPVEPAA